MSQKSQFTVGQVSETKQEGYRYHLGEVNKLKKASFTPISVEKCTCIVDPKLGLKGYINEDLFSLQSDKELRLNVKI